MDIRMNQINNLDFATIHRVMSSSNLTDGQKVQFLKNNSLQINGIINSKITSRDFALMMCNRPLVIGRPIKNSFTKRGDKKILAKSLNIEESDVEDYIAKVDADIVSDTGSGLLVTLDNDRIDTVKYYVYRHGKKQQVIDFLDYELSHAKNILKVLYQTLSYESAGVADYFSRPIHKLDNNSLVQMYKVIDKNLTSAKNSGQIDEITRAENSKWAMARIYQIQNNQRLRNAIKLAHELN